MEDWDLILKYIKAEVSEQEKQTVEQWIRAKKENEVLFDRIKNTWERSGVLMQPVQIDKTKAWQSIQQKIEQEKHTDNNLKSGKKNSVIWISGIAASIVIAVFVAFLVFNPDRGGHLVTVKTTDFTKMIVLPDSSRVFINKNSVLSYPSEFDSGTRNVSLSGEAFFEVERRPEQPFVIENNNFEVRVLGTSFNVSAYPNDTNASVNVVTGKVSFAGDKGSSTILEKGETGILNTVTHKMIKVSTANTDFLSWKTKKLEFRNEGFKEVGERLQAYFGITMEVKNERIYGCRFTGTFENPTLEEVIAILEKTLGIKAQINNKQVIVTGKGC